MNCREHFIYRSAFDVWGVYRMDRIIKLSIADLLRTHRNFAWGASYLQDIGARRKDLWL